MTFLYLLALVPVSLALGYWLHPGPVWVFAVAALAIVPLAEWIRRATEQLANRLGGAAGGLINISFGNAAELILAIFVLLAGNAEVVKAQITGSIIGNGLLGLGLAILVGSIGRDKQTFKRESAGRLSSLLILSVIALLLPALFDYTERGIFADPNAASLDEKLSLAVAVVLIVVYAANIVYTFVTHRDVFSSSDEDPPLPPAGEGEGWPLWKSLGVLVGATALTAVEAELVSGALEATASSLGLSTFFLGITVLAVIGNAAEYLSAIYFARKDHMNLVMTITVGSSIQVALLIAPVLVILSHFLGAPMNLVFANPLELIAIAGVAFSVNAIAQDGETTWFEGLLLVAVYVLLAFAFYFATPVR
jgi:Ca2+:H+ antiporter